MSIRTITLAASKGGVGKTTLAACFAVEAVKRNTPVALLDLDPQQSLARWWELRGEPENPTLVDLEGLTVNNLKKKLGRQGYQWLIIDTPPALMTRIQPAIEVADVVVVPVRPSPLDVEAIDPVVELSERARTQFVFVVNANPPRSSLTTGTIGYLEQNGEVLEEMVGYRTGYAGAMISGQVAQEIDKDGKAHDEIVDLWRAVSKLAKAYA